MFFRKRKPHIFRDTHRRSTLLARILIRGRRQISRSSGRPEHPAASARRGGCRRTATTSTCSSTRASSQPAVPIGGRTLTVSGTGRTRTLLFLQARCVPVTTMGTTGSPVCSAACTNPFLKGSSLPFLDRVPSGNKMRDRLFLTTARATWGEHGTCGITTHERRMQRRMEMTDTTTKAAYIPVSWNGLQRQGWSGRCAGG